MLTPENLKNITAVVEKYNIPAIKIKPAQRIALAGIKEEEIDLIWEEVDMPPGFASGSCVRSVLICPGSALCKYGKQDTLRLGMKLDEKYHGMPLPAKFKIGVSGCGAACSESMIKDVGFVGNDSGYRCFAGGSPYIGQLVAENLSEEEALEMTEKIISYVRD